jgi:glycoside/pentoside/hexuronide:cation symporter, GPH family
MGPMLPSCYPGESRIMSGISATSPAAFSVPRNAKGQLPVFRLATFSTLAIPIAAAQMPLLLYLPPLLAQQFGISLPVLGVIFMVEKFWGAVSDPLIGGLSDRTTGRFGRRRGWIAAGGLLFAIAVVLLYFPLLPFTKLLLCVALFLFYLSWSMLQIPYLAWSAEVSTDYDERTRVSTWQAVTAAIGLILIMAAMSGVEQVAPKNNLLKLEAIGAVLLMMIVITLPLTLKAFPEPKIEPGGVTKLSLLQALRILFSETLLIRILASDFAVLLGQSIRASLFVFFVVDYMQLPKWGSLLFLIQFLFALAAGPIWLQIGYRLGKHRAAVLGELIQAGINFSLLLLRPGDFVPLLVLAFAQGLTQGSGNLMLRAMVGDVADQHRLRTGEDRTALFFSVFSISMKAAMAVAVGIALPLAAWFGFNPKAVVNTPAALHGVQLIFALGPALAHLVAAALVYRFPLDAKAHADIRRQLDANTALEAAGLE